MEFLDLLKKQDKIIKTEDSPLMVKGSEKDINEFIKNNHSGLYLRNL